MPWYVYSLLTSLSLVGFYLCIKWLSARGIEPKQILLFMSGFASVGFRWAAAPSPSAVIRSSRLPGFLAAATFAGLFAAVGHWADFEAIKRAPNPSFAIALRNSSILPVAVFSVFLFGSVFHVVKLAGAVVILAGIAALVVDTKASAGRRGAGEAADNR
jgi:drug/metabolite transporter (DMT)-like permease